MLLIVVTKGPRVMESRRYGNSHISTYAPISQAKTSCVSIPKIKRGRGIQSYHMLEEHQKICKQSYWPQEKEIQISKEIKVVHSWFMWLFPFLSFPFSIFLLGDPHLGGRPEQSSRASSTLKKSSAYPVLQNVNSQRPCFQRPSTKSDKCRTVTILPCSNLH